MGRLQTTSAGRSSWSIVLLTSTLLALVAFKANAQGPLDPVLDVEPTYPNLVPDVRDIRIETYRTVHDGFDVEYGRFLWFDTRAQNVGDVPLQLTVDEVESPASSVVSQCVSWRVSAAHLCGATAPAGGFMWHEAHRHFHLENFGRYELRNVKPNGRPDYSSAGLIAHSGKVSFCLIDSRRIRSDAAPVPFYNTCLPTVQGISPGWTDIYTADLEGQNFDISGLPEGQYVLTVDLDHGNAIKETDDGDNYLVATIALSSEVNDVVIVGKQWPRPEDRPRKASRLAERDEQSARQASPEEARPLS